MADTPADPGGVGVAQGARPAPTILAVDDDADVLRATQRILEEAGFHVLTGATAAEALELTQRHHPALVLLDVMLPDGSGVDVARQLKSDPALADVFVILFSGTKVSSDNQARGLAEGLADGYMVRPLRRPELLARIDAFLRIRETQRALRESEERFRALVEWTPEAVVVHRGGKLIYVNPAAITMFGATSAEDLVGKPILELIHPESHEIVLDRMKKGLDDSLGAPLTALRYLKLDGTTIEAEVQDTAIVYDGEPAIQVALRDITARNLAEEALRKSGEQLASAVDGSGVGLWDWHPQSGEETFSDHWAEILGYTLDELAPTSIETRRRLTHPEDLQRADLLLEEHFSGQSDIYACEARMRHKDGHWVWVLDRGKVSEWDADGRPLRMIGTQLDISERKQAEEALRDVAARLALATRAGGVGLWDYFVTDGTVVWDEQMFALYGITRQQFSGAYEAWQASLHPDDRERGDAEIQAALRGEKEFDTEYRVLWPNGTIRVIRGLGLVQRDAAGLPTHMIGTSWDVTAQRRAQVQRNQALTDINVEQLRLNDELVGEGAILEAANATITRIAATDVLTGLANRRHFYQALEKTVSLARRHGSPSAVVSLDLDGLKRVNDSAGHRAGDEVLTSFAALLIDLCRAEDLPGRLGGDEFSVLLPGIELGGGGGLAERARAAVRSCEALKQRGVTVSGGVVQWSPGQLPDDLLRRADEALYAAKRVGGDAVASDG